MNTRTTIRTIILFAAAILVCGQLFHASAIVHADNVTVSGTVYDPDTNPWDCSGQNLTIRVIVNGGPSKGGAAYSTVCTDGGGTYSVGGVGLSPNDRITVFIDEPDVHGVHVSTAANPPTNMTFDLNQDTTLISTAGSGSISNTTLAEFDQHDNANILYSVTGTTATIVNGFEILPGGQFTAGGVINGAGASFAIDAGGSATFDGAGSTYGYISNAGTTSMTADAQVSTGLINTAGSLTAGAATTITLTNASLNVFSGTLSVGSLHLATGNEYFTQAGGTLAISGTVTVDSGVHLFLSNGTFTIGGSLVTQGTGTITVISSATPVVSVHGTAIGGGSGTIQFYDLTVASPGTTTWIGSGLNTVVHTLQITSGQLVAPALLYPGSIIENGGTFNGGSGTTVLSATSNTNMNIAGSFNNLTINDGLKGYWNFDESSGTTPADSSGFGNTGSFIGTPTISTDVPSLGYNNAHSLLFNGSSQLVGLGTGDSINNQFTNKITLSAWIKPTNLTGVRTIVGKPTDSYLSAPYLYWGLTQNADTIYFRIGTTVLQTSAGSLTYNVWQHVVGVYDGSMLWVYVDGRLVGSKPCTETIQSGSQQAGIGGHDTPNNPGEYFQGYIDEVRVYNRALPLSDIIALESGNQWPAPSVTYTLQHALTVTGTLRMEGGTVDVGTSNYGLTVGGSLMNHGGTIIPHAGTVTFTSGSNGNTITSGSMQFNNVTFGGGGWTLNDRLVAQGVLSLSGGSLDVSASNYPIYAGTVSQTGGTFAAQAGTVHLIANADQTVTLPSPYNVQTDDSIVGYWDLDEASGTTAADSSGYGRDATDIASPTQSTDVPAALTYSTHSMSLNGTTQYLNVAAPDFMGTQFSKTVTVSAWVKPNGISGTHSIVYGGDYNGSSYAWALSNTGAVVTFRIGSTTISSSGSGAGALQDGVWQHVAGVYDGNAGTMTLYIGGVSAGSTSLSTVIPMPLRDVRIGANLALTPAEFFNGKIDDVRVYARPVASSDVASLTSGTHWTTENVTYSLGADLTAGGTVTLHGATLNANTHQFSVNGAFAMTSRNATYAGSTAAQSFSSGISISGGSFTGSSGTTTVTGSFVQTGGTVATGAGSIAVSGNVTVPASGFTATAGNTIVMTGSGTLTATGNTLHGVTIATNGAVAFGDATLTIDGDLSMGSTGTVTPGTTTVVLSGSAGHLIGGGKTLYNVTVSGTNVTAQTSNIVVSHVLTVSNGALLTLNGVDCTVSEPSVPSLTLNGTIAGTGRLIYQNIGTAFPTSGTLTANLRFDLSGHGAVSSIILPRRASGYGGVELYMNASQPITVATNSSSQYQFSGAFVVTNSGTGNLTVDLTGGGTYNPQVVVSGNMIASKSGSGTIGVSTGTAGWSVGGSLDLTGATLTSGTGFTLTMTGSGTSLNGNGFTISNLTIASAGTVTLTGSDATVQSIVTVSSGTLTLGSGRTLFNNGALSLSGTLSGDGTFETSTGDIGTGGVFNTNLTEHINSAAVTVPTRTYYGATHTLLLVTDDGAEFRLGSTSAPFIIEGSLQFQDPNQAGLTVRADVLNEAVTVGGSVSSIPDSYIVLFMGSGTWSIGGTFNIDSIAEFYHDNGTILMSGDGSALISHYYPVYNLSVAGTGVSVTGLESVEHDLTITSGSLSVSSSTLSVDGNFVNHGVYSQLTGTLAFTASSTGHIIEAGSATINNLTFNNASGGWTVQTNDLAVVGTLSIISAAQFTVASGRTVSVGGTFSNAVGGTWTGSTLVLNGSNAEDDLNPKTSGGTVYGTVHIGANEHAYLWNSSATTVVTDAGGSLVSQNDAGASGSVRVYGSVHSRSHEYWSYGLDFDGRVLPTQRAVTAVFTDGARITVDAGDTFSVVGQSQTSNRTRLTAVDGGSYGVSVLGTLELQNAVVTGLNASGIVIGSTGSIASMGNTTFDSSSGVSGTYLTADHAVTTGTFYGIVFDSGATGYDTAATHSVVATGSGVRWTFVAPAGLKRSTVYADASNGAVVTMQSPIITVNDGDAADSDSSTTTTEYSLNWDSSSMIGIQGFRYGIGTTSGAVDTVALADVGGLMTVTRTGLLLHSGSTYYATVEAYDPNSETIAAGTSDGMYVDDNAPAQTNIEITAGESTAMVTWNTDEPSTSLVAYGTTASYGASTGDTTMLTMTHALTIIGLAPSTTYHLRITSIDRAGNQSDGPDMLFQTTAQPVATPPAKPSLRFAQVSDGASPTLTVRGSARGGQTVKLYVDSAVVKTIVLHGSAASLKSFTVVLPAGRYRAGTHSVFAKAFDENGQSSVPSTKLKFTIQRSAGRTRVLLKSATTYIVTEGDSLWKIARTFLGQGISYTKIVRDNVSRFPSLLKHPGAIVAGWVLKIIP